MRFILKSLVILAGIVTAIAARITYVRALPTIPRGAFAATDLPLNIAHRGGALEAPENTIHAFRHALQSGANAIEMDVWRSADGHLVVIHDDTVDRTTNGSGTVEEMTVAQLEQLDAAWNWNPRNLPEPPLRGQGITIPKLADVFSTFPEMPMIIELKTSHPEAVPQLAQLIQSHNAANRIIAASFNQRTINAMRRQFPGILTSAGQTEVSWFYKLHMVGLHGLMRPSAHSFQLPEYHGRIHLLSESMLRAMRSSGIDMHVWTIENPHDMQRMLDLGVDGIITSRPAELNRQTHLERQEHARP
jgi:glycerophosphoryl diester phosphodiesterase